MAHPYLRPALKSAQRQEFQLLPLKKKESDMLLASVARVNGLSGMSFTLRELDDELFTKRMNTYKNVMNYIALVSGRDVADASIKAGYFGESVRFDAVAQGLDTCWISSGLDQRNARAVIGFSDDEALAGVIAVGHAEEYVGLKEKLTAKKRQRKLEEFFSSDTVPVPRWVKDGVAVAINAPILSGVNSVKLSYTRGFVALSFDESKPAEALEAGAVMLHFEIAANVGRWLRDPRSGTWVFADMRDE